MEGWVRLKQGGLKASPSIEKIWKKTGDFLSNNTEVRTIIDELNHLFEIEKTRLFNVVYRLTGNYADSHDILQDAFVRALESQRNFRGESSPKTWLYRIAVNCAYTYLSGRRRELEPTSSIEVAESRRSAEETVLSRERDELIQAALMSLDAKFRTLVLLRELEGMSYEEIAQVLRLSPGTVASRLSRARRLLARKLRKLGVV